MDLLYDVVVVVHLLGMAALVGGWFAVLGSRDTAGRAVTVMQRGAEAQVLTGLILVGLAEAVLDRDLDHVKIGVKLVVAVAAVGLVSVAGGRRRRGQGDPSGLVHAAGALGVLNVLIAVLWT